jgi:predicted RNA binding protein YcfA (HicA-like mRNA interferase family)
VPLKQLSSRDVEWLLAQVGIMFKRHGKEDIFEGVYKGQVRTVVVPRNKKRIPKGTLSSILRQAGMTMKEAEQIFDTEQQRDKS